MNLAGKSYSWWKALRRLLANVDAVHVRCPNNISILGLLALSRSDCLRQALYTGTWNGYPGEPSTYRWQRWFLKHRFKGPVAVYGDWPGQPPHVVPSFSPSYSQADWEMESAAVAEKLGRLRNAAALAWPIKLVTVGSLSRNKNQQLVVRAVGELKGMGWDTELHVFGEGETREVLSELARTLGVERQVHFHGNTPHHLVRQFYREADFVVQAPLAEGYGKVPVEAFFHGVVPILSDVNLSSQIVGGSERGRTFRQGDARELALRVVELAHDPAEVARLIENGRAHACSLTLESWQQHIRAMLEQSWKTELGAGGRAHDDAKR